MKKLCVIIIFLLCLSLFSCKRELDCYELLCEFAEEYSFSGPIYRSGREFHEDGYLSEEMFKTVYIYSLNVPDEYAVYLNSRAWHSGECGIFKAKDAEERRELVLMCRERCKLISKKEEEWIVLSSGNFVFYSTLSDRDRAKEIFYSIIK